MKRPKTTKINDTAAATQMTRRSNGSRRGICYDDVLVEVEQLGVWLIKNQQVDVGE